MYQKEITKKNYRTDLMDSCFQSYPCSVRRTQYNKYQLDGMKIYEAAR